ncbi:NACHT, LRR and PYD domains-containing protein 1b allele 1-like isoform X4 [Sebastes umbrosus]|uniref:NACHT, LRR and PYD domains-containing protein 1b allele 1-like isoform X4 n=1 Tax=Sebastes umbrosus TaxID=72105 RepID=UPI00189CE331|nr:NACHT, LRR and PYD domains-containing protein 1b allele 1-like isoform X4 [Sebastes umbrosus]
MEARGPFFKPDPKGGPPSDEHIVDRCKDQLIHNVSDVEPILDELLTKMVIQQESYDKISAPPTSEEKMRELLDGHLTAVGSKDIFYDLSVEKQKPEHEDPRMSGSDDGHMGNVVWHEGSSSNKLMVVTGSEMSPEVDWIKLEPEVNCVDAEYAPIYSLQSEAGNFECSVSGLRWVSKDKVSLKYQFGSWEEHMERLKTLDYFPGGPLLDVTVIAGKLDEAYLPHWICTEDVPRILRKMAVLHIDTCGDVVEQVSEVTPSHVKLSQPIFSPKGVLMRVGFPVKINCKVLIYKTNEAFLTLHVYLIPRDPALQQTIKKKESSRGHKMIQKQYPEKSLKMRDRFILTADLDSAEIYPEKLKLIYEGSDPNFFEVFIENPDSHFQLTIRHESEPVWTCAIRKDDYQNTGDIQEKYDKPTNCVEQVSGVTQTHVKLSQPIRPLRGILMRFGLPVKINCKVLIYKTNKAFLTLHVYLIPHDPALQQVIAVIMLIHMIHSSKHRQPCCNLEASLCCGCLFSPQNIEIKESYRGSKMIQKPYPEKSLQMRDRFILTADLESAEIYPEKLKLMYEGSDPNFFEVFIENPDSRFQLTIRHGSEPVWTCAIQTGQWL